MKIYGAADGETIEGTARGERIFAGGGSDILHGNGGADWLYGEDGNDTIDVTSRTTLASGGNGDDIFNVLDFFAVNGKTNQVIGGTGVDTFDASTISTYDPTLLTIWFVDTNGSLTVDDFAVREIEIIKGLASGNFFSLAAADNALTVYGGGENDLFARLTEFADTMYGLGGDDFINVGSLDTAYGGDGNDAVQFVDGNGFADGGDGIDTISGGGNVDVAGGYFFGPDRNAPMGSFINFENATIVSGSAYGDENANILTSRGPSELYGRGGDDILRSGNGIDYLDGGAGIDTASFEDASNVKVAVRFAENGDTTVTLNGVANDVLHDIEGVIGGNANDNLKGNSRDNILSGGGGNDVLYGGAGSDRLDGGDGTNRLTGGAGNDTFLFSVARTAYSGKTDVIADFSQADHDRIDVSVIDADPFTPGDQAFRLVFNQSPQPGELNISIIEGMTYIGGYPYDSKYPGVSIAIPGAVDFQASDFVL